MARDPNKEPFENLEQALEWLESDKPEGLTARHLRCALKLMIKKLLGFQNGGQYKVKD